MLDEQNSTQSILDPTKETRMIRSHRAPGKSIRVSRMVVFVAAVVMGGGAIAPVAAVEQAPVMVVPNVVEVSPIQSFAAVARGTTVDRYQRVAAVSRKTKIERVIKYAMAQRGDRYRWGATGPSSWDCSGLISVAFKKGAGKALPHFTGGIQKKGVKVSKKNLKRGDIVFPQRGHVGIYLGGGKMVHASSGKGKVVVAKMYGFYTARRVI